VSIPVIFEEMGPTYRPWPFRITWHHWSHDHSIILVPFPISGPLESSLYLQPFLMYLAQHMLTNKHTVQYTLTNIPTNKPTNQQTRWIAIPPNGGNIKFKPGNSLTSMNIKVLLLHKTFTTDIKYQPRTYCTYTF